MGPSDTTEHQVIYLNIENISKILPIGLVALYVLGFLVIMGHLAQYGVSSLEVFRLHYLVAGFWCLVPFLVFRVLGTAAELQRLAWKDKGLARSELIKGGLHYLAANIGYMLIFALILMFFGYLGLGGRHVFDYFLSDWKLWLKVLLFVSGSEVSLSYARLFYRRANKAKEKSGDSTLDATLARFATVLSTVLFLVYVGLFATRIYPQIPHHLGGGKPLSVAFVLVSGNPLEKPLLIPEKDSPQTIPYRLLLERENSLVVISPVDSVRAIELDRKAIVAILILNDSKSAGAR